MALEIEGKIISKLAVQSGQSARGPWAKQDFVIEYLDGKFPEKACLQVWGQDKVAELEKYNIDDTIKASFRPLSREFNGRWYTDLRVWKISGATVGATEAASVATTATAAPNAQQAPPPTTEDLPGANNDDLPF